MEHGAQPGRRQRKLEVHLTVQRQHVWAADSAAPAPHAAAGISIALVTPQEAQRFLALTRVLARRPPPTFPLDLSLMKEVHRRVGLALKVGGRWAGAGAGQGRRAGLKYVLYDRHAGLTRAELVGAATAQCQQGHSSHC
jgi:hypothetical protein